MDTEAKDLGRIMLPVDSRFEESALTILNTNVVALETEAVTIEDNDWYDKNALYQIKM